MKIHQYKSYQEYKDIQIAGNKAKLSRTWAKKENIKMLATFLQNHFKNELLHGICHGTRRGNEQVWFLQTFSEGSKVIGTEISDTAKQFPFTMQWDFNYQIHECVGKCDFVYSNSHDHSPDPKKTFQVWSEQLKIGGLLILEHSNHHTSEFSANELDPTGFDSDEDYINILARQKHPGMQFLTSLDAPNKGICKYMYYLIFERVS